MARKYRVDGRVKLINRIVGFLNRFGLAGPRTYTLTTIGRKSGREHSTPVTLAVRDGARFLVAPYGPVAWVHNIRAAGSATLSRKGRDEAIAVRELSASEAGPVLHRYYREVKITRPYFDVPTDAGVDAFVAVAGDHPVFEITA